MNLRHIPQVAVLFSAIALPLAAGSITTTFAGGNRFTGNMFDATIGGKAIVVNGLDVNVDPGPLTIDVYIKTGSYVGFDTTPAAWTLVSATAVTGLGAGNQTVVAVTPFTLAAGATYGIYITIDSTTNAAPYMYYTKGSNVYPNADLSLSLGDGIGGKFGSLAVFPGRTWNGIINYSLVTAVTAPEPNSLALLAGAIPGCLVLRRRYLRKY